MTAGAMSSSNARRCSGEPDSLPNAVTTASTAAPVTNWSAALDSLAVVICLSCRRWCQSRYNSPPSRTPSISHSPANLLVIQAQQLQPDLSLGKPRNNRDLLSAGISSRSP